MRSSYVRIIACILHSFSHIFMYNPLITVGIPTYNYGDFIEQSLQSVLKQSYSHLDIIVVDNCSTDSTWQYLKRFDDPRLRIFRNEKTISMAENWSKCVLLAKGQFFRFLMSDDMFDEAAIARFINLSNNYNFHNRSSYAYISKGAKINIYSMFAQNENSNSYVVSKKHYLNSVKHFNFSLFTAMPNAYILPTKELISSIKSNAWFTMKEKYGITGHCADYFLFAFTLKKLSYIICDDMITYKTRDHSRQGSKKYNSNIYYHLAGDLFANMLIFEYNNFQLLSIMPHSLRILKPHLKTFSIFSIGKSVIDLFRFYLLLLTVLYKNIFTRKS